MRAQAPLRFPTATVKASTVLPDLDTYKGSPLEYGRMEATASDPAVQQQIRQGQVDLGYTPDMVYMALGQPTKHINRVTNDGTETTWIYKSYYEEYEGSALAGYRRYVVPDRATGRYVVYHEPVYTDLYRERSQEYIRLSFKNGKVTAIEQTQAA